MIYPDLMTYGDTIGFVAPSFSCAIEPYRTAFISAKDRFKKMGYQTLDGPLVYADDGVGISSSPKRCAAEFMDMYCSDTSQALISCGGGELMCEILPYIDFDRIRKAKAKWFMGYSDNTNLTFTLATLADTAAVYAPCVSSFGMDPWHRAIADAFGIIGGDLDKVKSDDSYEYAKWTDDSPIASFTVKSYNGWESESLKDEEHPTAAYHITREYEPYYYHGHGDTDISKDSIYLPDGARRLLKNTHTDTVSGRLIGGCLDCLQNIAGTSYDAVDEFNRRYEHDHILWFLESCDLNVMDIRRALWHLKEAGWFENASGFLIGRPMHFDEPMMGLDRHLAVTEVLGELKVPIYMDLDIGHLPPMMPIVCGAYAYASWEDGRFCLRMEKR